MAYKIWRLKLRVSGQPLFLIVLVALALTAPDRVSARYDGIPQSGKPRQSRPTTTSPATAPAKDACKVERDRLKVEEELRVALRTLRQAIDNYKMACEMGQIGPLDRVVNDECYPPNMAALVNGVKPPNRNVAIRYLRRIPVDPTTGQASWGMRSMQDEPDAEKWGGQNIFDVYSLSLGTALDGTKYKDW